MESHATPSDHQHGEEASGDEDDDDEDADPFTEEGPADEDDVDMEEAPQETIDSVALEEEEEGDSEEEDISENDPIHNYEPSETEDSDGSNSDTEDESYTEQDVIDYKSAEVIEDAQKLGLTFYPNGRLRGTSVLAVYVRHGILEMCGPFNLEEGEPRVDQNAPYIPQFEDLPLVLSGATFSRAGGVSLPVQQRTSRGPSNRPPVEQLHNAIRVSRDGSWVTLPRFRSLVRSVLRYQPKEFEKPGHIRISNQIRHPGFQALLTKLYANTYWLPLPQAAFVTDQLLFVEPKGRPFKLTLRTLVDSRQLSTQVGEAENFVHHSRIPATDAGDEKDVQQHPLSMGYASSSQLLALAEECKSMVTAILSDFPQAKPRAHPSSAVDEVDDFLGPPRRPVLELQPWKPIKMSMPNNDSTRLNIGEVNKFLVFANKQAMLAIDIYEPDLLMHDLHFKGLTMAHIFRCVLRIKVIAELAECLDNEGLRVNRDGPMWSLLLPFYVNGGTPNAAEMSVIAGQAPQFGRPRPNWDQPIHGLHNILHASRLTRFPMDLVHRDQFWEWVEHRGR